MDESERLLLKIKKLRSKTNGIHIDAEEWGEFSEVEQIVYSIEWDNDVGSMRILEAEYHSGTLNEEQTAAYEDLRADVRRVLPVLERLDLWKPDFI